MIEYMSFNNGTIKNVLEFIYLASI